MSIFITKPIKQIGQQSYLLLPHNLFLVIFLLLWQQQIKWIDASNSLLLCSSQNQTKMFAYNKTAIQGGKESDYSSETSASVLCGMKTRLLPVLGNARLLRRQGESLALHSSEDIA